MFGFFLIIFLLFQIKHIIVDLANLNKLLQHLNPGLVLCTTGEFLLTMRYKKLLTFLDAAAHVNNIERRIQAAYLLYECKQRVELFLQIPGSA